MNTTEMGTFRDNQNAAPGHDMALMCDYMAHAMKKTSQQRMLATLPLEVRKRVRALRKLQLQTTELEAEFHRQVYDLERKHQDAHAALFEKRNGIVNGTYEPNEDECDYPDAAAIDEQTLRLLEDAGHLAPAPPTPAIDLKSEGAPASGVPLFWLNIFKYGPMFELMVKPADEAALRHLSDIKVHIAPLPDMSFQLRFHFAPNAYFENAVLTKEYLMKCEPDNAEPFAFDGPEIHQSRGCAIQWKAGMDLTQRVVRRKGVTSGTATDGSGGAAGELRKTESFFAFFDPPQLPEDTNHPEYDAINKCLQHDFEIGHYLKERIVPRAVLYFTGENDDDFDDDDDEDDDDEDDDEDSSDDGGASSGGEAGGAGEDSDGESAPKAKAGKGDAVE